MKVIVKEECLNVNVEEIGCHQRKHFINKRKNRRERREENKKKSRRERREGEENKEEKRRRDLHKWKPKG